ncbi:MAG: cytidylate kinase-like family protein [Deltaproteobacteria bacterium]
MAIITISRGCFSHGKEIAERVAESLGYECVSREVLIEAAHIFDVSEKKLLRSLHDGPTILERMTHGREKYLSYIQVALLEHVKKDNVVYHGHAGHLLLPKISHVLKVRVIAELEERVGFLQQKEQISKNKALAFIREDDKQRANWTHYLYGTEIGDPSLYDMVLNIGRLKIENACEIICTVARSETYKATVESRKAVEDLAISSHVKVALQDICAADVHSENGYVHIKAKGQKLRKTGGGSKEIQLRVREKIRADLTKEISQRVRKIPGVKGIFCDIDLPYYS